MAEMNIMPLMTDAVMADCGYMPNAAFGAYMRMLIGWWRTGAKPMSAARLKLISGATDDEFAMIAEHLTETPEGYIQRKLVETWERQSGRCEAARQSASKRWARAERVRTQCERNANASNSHDVGICERNANAMLTMNHEPIVVIADAITTRAGRAIDEQPRLQADKKPVRGRKRSPSGTPLDALSEVLTPETAQAVVDHRNALRRPLTAYAAQLLAAKFLRCRDGPEAAAKAMIANGWQGFNPEWGLNGERGNHGCKGRGSGIVGDVVAVLREIEDVDRANADAIRGDDDRSKHDQIRIEHGGWLDETGDASGFGESNRGPDADDEGP